MLSVPTEGRWLSQNKLQCVSGLYVIGLQVVGTTLRQVTTLAERVGDIDRRLSCKGTANISSPATYADKSGHVYSYGGITTCSA